MNYFLIGTGIAMLALGLAAFAKVNKLEKKLKETGVLEDGWDDDRK